MGHPMDGYYDGLRAERDRLWARRDALEARLKPMSIAEFTVAQFPDLLLLMDRTAPSERPDALKSALDRLEAAFPPPRKKPLKRAARRRSS